VGFEYGRRTRRPHTEEKMSMEMRLGREIRSLDKKKNELDKYYEWIDSYTKELISIAVMILSNL
jgi:hypothetical protein